MEYKSYKLLYKILDFFKGKIIYMVNIWLQIVDIFCKQLIKVYISLYDECNFLFNNIFGILFENVYNVIYYVNEIYRFICGVVIRIIN